MTAELTPDELLTTTRAVRRRLDLGRPVPRSVITRCIEIALQAPNGGDQQRWRWLVVTDDAIRGEVAGIYREVARPAFERAQSAAVGPGRRVYSDALYLADVLHRIPALVIPCVEGRPSIRLGEADAAGFFGSIIPAIWSFQLALRARGLGTCYTTAHLRAAERVAKVLAIPDGVTQVALLPVAYTTGTSFRPASRAPVEDVAFADRWGSPWIGSAADT